MQKYLSILLILMLAVACGGGSTNSDKAEKPLLTVTIEPQRYFLEQLAGEDYRINTLVPPGTSPETYEPSPSVMIDLGKSAIYFRVGDLGFEKVWSARLVENNPDVNIVDCSVGIELMAGDLHDHDHDHGDHGDHAGHADHSGQDHTPGALDPHVWSSPRAMRIFARNMLDALVKTNPERAEFYQENHRLLTEKIDAVDSTLTALLNKAPSRSFIIYHPALGYLARDYGLQQHSIEFEGKSPSPAQLKELVDLARQEEINTLFVQRGFDLKNGEVIARELGAELFEIDPLRYEWDYELIRIATILSRQRDE
ncbi:MAG: zinc ABC transporter substrate-binding protein [Proteiniphilum sp.]|jgi:zinc transport system substrate-binding protein|nr:zinc ABC transporter substrate-binding protein [Proteiniphilum sp.]MDD3333042.1 zinc ABC transporter substrate-binding protein [Proteiniphilum sp.]MDD3979939.1 zinc ABC transporter substrate-binding protein [Proteiniphilum sp.]